MGSGRDKKKKAKGTGKKAHSDTASKEKKHASKQQSGEDVDALLAQVESEASANECSYCFNSGSPSPPRSFFASASLQSSNELLLHGGERVGSNGLVRCFSDLHRLHIPSTSHASWSKLTSGKSAPNPRSGHQLVTYEHGNSFRRCYLFGGELCTPREDRFHHYCDLWRFHPDAPAQHAWRKLPLRGKNGGAKPCARSGHRMCICPHSPHVALLFGGYFDSCKPKEGMMRFNDLFALDMEREEWTLLARLSSDSVGPEPRSACNLIAEPESQFVYVFGGFSRSGQPPVRTADEPPEPEEGGPLADAWRICVSADELESGRESQLSKSWERVPQGGAKPGTRAGTTMVRYRRKAIVFGGSFDRNTRNGEDIVSEFTADLHGFDLTRQKWQLMRPCCGGGLNLQYVKPLPQMSTTERAAATIQATWRGHQARKTYRLMRANGQVSEMTYSKAERRKSEVERLKYPIGRMKAAAVVLNTKLIIYGGVVEVNDQDFALQDCWVLDLDAMDHWHCVEPLGVELPKDSNAAVSSDGEGDSE